MFVKSPDEGYFGQAHVGMLNGIKEFLDMRNMDKDISSESTRKHDHLFKDWVTKNIIEIKDQGCTRIACISEGLSKTHAWKETHYDIPLWMVEYDLEEVSNNIPYGSKNKIPYSSIDWVDRDTFGMKTLGGEEFYFCNNFFVGTVIVLTYEQYQRLIL